MDSDDSRDYDDGEHYEEEEAGGMDFAGLGISPDHPLLARVQKAITEHLEGECERYRLDVKETGNDLIKTGKDREQIAVDLYGVQQRLARLQVDLEDCHDRYNSLHRQREETEAEADSLNEVHGARKAELQDQISKVLKYQEELDRIHQTLREVEAVNEEMKSQIQVERRTAFKTEENISNLEKAQKVFDIRMDALQERKQRLEEMMAVYDAQIAAQRDERKVAGETLSEATTEMDAIRYEKKQLLQQWKSSVIGMQRRDEALKSMEEALQKQVDDRMNLETEIKGYDEDIMKQQEKNEELSAMFEKLEKEKVYFTNQIERGNQDREALHQTYSRLKKSLESTESEVEKAQALCRRSQHSIKQVENQIQQVVGATRDLEDSVLKSMNEQTTLEKGAFNTLQAVEKLKRIIRDKEMQIGTIQNEMERIRIDTINTDQHNKVLSETLVELEAELKEKDKLVEKYQMEIRRRHDEVERKQKDLDLLNRRFDSIGGEEVENAGPLEATIKNLTKTIQEKHKDCDMLQREWLKEQTMLVSLEKDLDTLLDGHQDLNNQWSILSQKKMRLEADSERQRKEIQRLNNGLDQLHLRMTRLNSEIAKTTTSGDDLSQTTLHQELEYMDRLKDREIEMVQLQDKVADTKQEKARVLGEMMDIEHQIMMWEKKIQITKETMEALDPTVGQEDIKSMQKEIHIMELRIADMKKRQRLLVEEMEKAVAKRDIIGMKGRALKSNPKSGTTRAGLQQELTDRAREVEKKKVQKAKADTNLQSLIAESQELSDRMESSQAELEEIRNAQEQAQANLERSQVQRQALVVQKSSIQRQLQKYQSVEAGKYKMAVKPDSLPAEYRRSAAKVSRVLQLVEELQQLVPAVDRFEHIRASLEATLL